MICIAVIGGTSTAPVAKVMLDAATTVGQLLAASRVRVLTSGIRHGVIGRVLDELQGSSTPRSALVVRGTDEEKHLHPAAGTVVLVPSIADRKNVILAQSHAVIALPGGLGTHDEIITFLVERKTGAANAKALILANAGHYFSPMMRMLENMVSEGFLKRRHLADLHLMPDAEAVVSAAMELGSAGR